MLFEFWPVFTLSKLSYMYYEQSISALFEMANELALTSQKRTRSRLRSPLKKESALAQGHKQ